MASSKNIQYGNGGFVYQNKLYMVSETPDIAEVYDPASNTWTLWNLPKMGVAIGLSPCAVQWKDAFFLIGGTNNAKAIRM